MPRKRPRRKKSKSSRAESNGMINHTVEELRLILQEEELNEELREAEKIYQRKSQAERDRHNRYRKAGIGYILEPEKTMNYSDRRKLDMFVELSNNDHITYNIMSTVKRHSLYLIGLWFVVSLI